MINSSWSEDPHAVKTTAGEIFTGEDHRQLARMVYKRFGRNAGAAASAWRRMFENNCTEKMFMMLVMHRGK